MQTRAEHEVETERILWPLTCRIVLDECARDALLHSTPSGKAFDEPEYQRAAKAIEKAGMIEVRADRYFITETGWDALRDAIFRKVP